MRLYDNQMSLNLLARPIGRMKNGEFDRIVSFFRLRHLSFDKIKNLIDYLNMRKVCSVP
jgi:hypothetical protein